MPPPELSPPQRLRICPARSAISQASLRSKKVPNWSMKPSSGASPVVLTRSELPIHRFVEVSRTYHEGAVAVEQGGTDDAAVRVGMVGIQGSPCGPA